MEITAIKKDGKRQYVFLDGEQAFWLYPSELRELRLQTGMELSDGQYEDVLCRYIVKRAKLRALHLLEKMDRTKVQLTRKLLENGYPKQAVEQAVAYMESCHYLDDRRYAETYIGFHIEKDSCRKIRMDLLQKGIDKETVELLLENACAGIDRKQAEAGQIQYWIRKKRYPVQPHDEKEKRRLYSFLLRKGYESREILSEMAKAEQFREI